MTAIRSFMNCGPVRFLAVASLAFSLTGCANIQNDETRTKVEGAGGGAIIGALLGAGLGALGGGGGSNIARGAAIGAVLGGGLGLAYANHVVGKKRAYATEEQWLDNCIASARSANARAVAHNQTLSAKIAGLRQQISAAKAANDRAALAKHRAVIVQLQRENAAQSKTLSNEISAQQYATKNITTDSGRSRLAGMNSQISSLQSTQSTVNTNSRLLADLATSASL